jgi:N-methylhydantoinase A
MRLGIDVGGTFTDLVAYDATRRRLVVDKMLNHTGGSGVDVVDALKASAIEPAEVAEFTHGTTKVTNLLIERSGARVGLLCSRGFRDVLEIQLSFRERSFDIFYEKVAPLVPRHLRLEVRGRILASGGEAEPQDDSEIQTAIEALLADGIDSLAVALHNSYANPMHERHIQDVAMAIAPELPVSLSSTVDPRIGEYQRVSTCVLNALAVPTMQAYADDLRANLPFAALYMQSAAGVMPADEVRERPIHLAFSGPAAGVVAGREIARQLGFQNAITMDMGGTSFDVCLIWGDELVYRDQLDIDWGVPARVESLDLHTIGAGGGSICWRDSGGTLTVGPRSAGAIPGPVCYGRGGEEPTVTDANLVLGILSPDGLLGGQLTLDKERATEAFRRLGAAFDVSAEEAARGAYAIVNANMAQAIRTITVEKGIDPRDCALVAFGGAGPQHAATVAELLGMRNVVIPAETSVLSALGLLTADVRLTAVRTLLRPLAALGSGEVEEVFRQLEAEATNRMNVGPAGDEPLSISRHVGLRYVGQSHEVPLRLLSEDTAVDDRF